ncbi:MAG TPA: hypothetical protein VII49_02825 [Rhizomicrobium sp.]
MAANDLTTLPDVKAWLGRTDSNSDALLAALITRTSRQVYSHLQRPTILPHAVSEMRDGTGTNALVLKQWPVVAVSSVTVGPVSIPQAPALLGAGWSCEQWDGIPPGRPQTLSLRGYVFGCSFPGARNTANVLVVYRAGYQVVAEPQTVNAGTAIVNAPYGAWACDSGVTYANGTPLELVSGTPGSGQYQLAASPGTYNFNSADNGAAVLIGYGYVPFDLADACIELVGERYKYAERIGEKTHSLGGNETVSFDNSRFTPLIAAMLQPYRNIIPA